MRARNVKAARYREVLGRNPAILFQEHLPGCRPAYKDFAILCPGRRDELAAHLAEAGIQTKKYFYPLHRMPAFARFRGAADDLADTEAAAAAVLCLPMFNDLDEADIDRVGLAILRFYEHG